MNKVIICFLLVSNCLGAYDEGHFLEHIFDKYGNGTSMPFEGFEHLLQEIGLGNLTLKHELHKHKEGGKFKEFHSTHNHAYKSVPKHPHNHEHEHDEDHHHNKENQHHKHHNPETNSIHSHMNHEELENSKSDSVIKTHKESTGDKNRRRMNRQKRTTEANRVS